MNPVIIGQATLYHADCIEVMAGLAENSLDSIICDPPYLINFMNKGFDTQHKSLPGANEGQKMQEWHRRWVTEAYRILKPGGHLAAFGGDRTHHRLMSAMKDVGFELRFCCYYLFGSGFPKSADAVKMLNKHNENYRLNTLKAIDNLCDSSIISEWKKHLRIAKYAGLSFQKSKIEIGMNMQKKGSAQEFVALQAKQKDSHVIALLAELSLVGHVHIYEEEKKYTAQSYVSENEKQNRVKYAEYQQQKDQAKLSLIGIAQENAKESQNESLTDKLKEEEALKTWLGKVKFSNKANINVLCAELTEILKLIILSPSKTFQSLGTTQQTECASAINVIITEYMAECLISFMVNTLKDQLKKSDKEVCSNNKYQGYGTALKPAVEPICVGRKPMIGTLAENLLTWGCGAMNLDACRVEYINEEDKGDPLRFTNSTRKLDRNFGKGGEKGDGGMFDPNRKGLPIDNSKGRFPPHLLHDGSDVVKQCFPESKSCNSSSDAMPISKYRPSQGNYQKQGPIYPGDSGSASRFFPSLPYDEEDCATLFYCAKASKSDRGEFNNHVSVKPTALMRWICRLLTPKGGSLLDPFMGSGSTLKAAVLENFSCIGIERDEDYFAIAEARVAHVSPEIVEVKRTERSVPMKQQASLF